MNNCKSLYNSNFLAYTKEVVKTIDIQGSIVKTLAKAWTVHNSCACDSTTHNALGLPMPSGGNFELPANMITTLMLGLICFRVWNFLAYTKTSFCMNWGRGHFTLPSSLFLHRSSPKVCLCFNTSTAAQPNCTQSITFHFSVFFTEFPKRVVYNLSDH